MGLLVKDIFKLGLLKEAVVVSGNAGLNNEIIWINMMEILDELDSLQKGELLITTGYGLDDEERYGSLIGLLKEKELAGIGIQPGYYLEEIPEYIIECGEKYGFPVIRIPKKITFSHITRTIFKELQVMEESGGHYKDTGGNIILDILEGNRLEGENQNYIMSIVSKEESAGALMLVFSISHKEDGIIIRSDIKASVKKVCDTLLKHNCRCHYESIGGKIAILFSIPEKTDIHDIYVELENVTEGLAKSYSNLIFTVGISSYFNSVEKISECYYEALYAQQMLEKINALKGVCRYDEVDILHFVETIGNKESLTVFSDEALRTIIAYDESNSTNYLQTLKCYLTCNCNMNQTAKSLFIHRHTLRYRLERIEKLCDIDFMSIRSRLKFMLAILIYDLYR